MNPLDILLSEMNSTGLSVGTFIILLVIVIFVSILLGALLGLISARIMKLPNITYKKSFLANFCNLAINVILRLIYLILPFSIQISNGLSIFHLFVGFFIMSYLYSYFFKVTYKQGMLVTLIAAAIAVVIFLIITFTIDLVS